MKRTAFTQRLADWCDGVPWPDPSNYEQAEAAERAASERNTDGQSMLNTHHSTPDSQPSTHP